MTRQERSEYWLEGGFPGAFAVESSLEARLYQTFIRVLSAMTEEQFEEFDTYSPTIICQPDVNGAAFSYFIPVPHGGDGGKLHVLYFDPRIGRFGDETLGDLVAHETAHLVLGHTDVVAMTGAGKSGAQREAEADALITAWGFRSRYSKKHLARMKARDRALGVPVGELLE